MTRALTSTRSIPSDDLSPPDHPSAPEVDVRAWQDDPGSGLDPIERPAPNLAARPLPLTIDWRDRAPQAAEYRVATRAFRYWTAAEALRRAADFWAGIVPAGTRWWPGETLSVGLDDGVDLNANYDRSGLHFFHERVGDDTVYSGESPDVVCHELGHAVLDAVKPDLFHTASLEVAAFHEAFGDISAILAALQLQPVRRTVIEETGGRYRSSPLSRLAEQMGAAIRRIRPDAVEADCLRNAVNSFVYRLPAQLPPWGPASTLSCEPHSFSRVFTAGFFEALCLMASDRSARLTEQTLAEVSAQAGRLLIDAVRSSPVPSRIFGDVAARMVDAAAAVSPRYPALLHAAFHRRAILSTVPAAERKQTTGLRLLALPGGRYGLGNRRLYVLAAGDLGETQAFVRWLVARGRIEAPPFAVSAIPTHPHTVKSHRLVQERGPIVLKRILFDCGFHADS
ncbi:MAG TPA: hypothetical protein VET65_05120 [Candidatus Limnocylindrales bacterium]|nr:hypothetical protein [Candidatus Limnocylindrales bacterium]